MALTWAASRILYPTDYDRHGRITADTPVTRWPPADVAMCGEIDIIPRVAVIGTNQHPTLDKALADAKRQLQAIRYIVETVLPDQPKTLGDAEAWQCYQSNNGDIVWADDEGKVCIRSPDGFIGHHPCRSFAFTLEYRRHLGHVRDVLRLAEHLDPAVNGCGPANPPETPDSCPKTLADVPPLHCYRDRGGLMVWKDARGIAMFRSSDGLEFECIGKPESIRIVGPRIEMKGGNNAK